MPITPKTEVLSVNTFKLFSGGEAESFMSVSAIPNATHAVQEGWDY
jgi:hypothetical protein